MKKILVVGLVIMCMLILLTPTIVADDDECDTECPYGYVPADSDGDGKCDVCDPDEIAEIPDGSHTTQ